MAVRLTIWHYPLTNTLVKGDFCGTSRELITAVAESDLPLGLENLGTASTGLPGDPEGEEAFHVVLGDDGTVNAEIVAFLDRMTCRRGLLGRSPKRSNSLQLGATSSAASRATPLGRNNADYGRLFDQMQASEPRTGWKNMGVPPATQRPARGEPPDLKAVQSTLEGTQRLANEIVGLAVEDARQRVRQAGRDWDDSGRRTLECAVNRVRVSVREGRVLSATAG